MILGICNHVAQAGQCFKHRLAFLFNFVRVKRNNILLKRALNWTPLLLLNYAKCLVFIPFLANLQLSTFVQLTGKSEYQRIQCLDGISKSTNHCIPSSKTDHEFIYFGEHNILGRKLCTGFLRSESPVICEGRCKDPYSNQGKSGCKHDYFLVALLYLFSWTLVFLLGRSQICRLIHVARKGKLNCHCCSTKKAVILGIETGLHNGMCASNAEVQLGFSAIGRRVD
jgi:hypothetical protein